MSILPGTLRASLQGVLEKIGDTSPLKGWQAISGGCINNATRVETEQGTYCLKWNADPLPGLFNYESDGLRILASTNTVRVPRVHGYGENDGSTPAFILLEWLEGCETRDQATLGEQLAALHRSQDILPNPPRYGFAYDNYLGSTLQLNPFETDWPTFFIEHRIKPLMMLCQQRGRISPERRHRLDKLLAHLPDLLNGVNRCPSLIHGDLWAGNVIACGDNLALIDPAVSFSDREAELAYTQLFGGFTARFYQAYQAVWPLEPGYADRRYLYNLYHLLNHVYIFGEQFGHQVDSILVRFT